MALPSGIGDAAVLIQSGIDAVGLSSAGERPLPASDDQEGDLSEATLGDFGRAALSLAAALDSAPGPPDHGPDAYVTLSGNLVPGWTLALLALTLLLPAAIASIVALGHALRGRQQIGPALWWAVSRGLPLVAALLLLYLLAISGVVARPRFPFDPNQFGTGGGEIAVMALLAAVVVGGCYLARGWRVPANVGRGAAVAALGLVSVLAVLRAWFANPFGALLLVPAAHVWLLDALGERAPPWPAVLAAAALSLVPVAAAVADLVGRLDLGASGPWQLLLMIGDGQIGFGATLAMCLLVGCLMGIVALAGHRPPADRAAVAGPRQAARSPVEAEPVPAGPDDLDASTIARSRGDDDHEDGR